MAGLKFKQRFRRWFFTGLLVLLPAIVSIEVLWWLLKFVDDMLKPFFKNVTGWSFFGIGIALLFVIIMFVGMLAQNYLGRKLVDFVQKIFDHLPFVRTVYSVVRQLIEPFSSESGNSFRQVVLFEYPMKDRYSVGLIANAHAGTVNGENMVTIFMPSNHLHLGYLAFVPEKDVIPIDLSIEEALKIVVSCGIVLPKACEIQNGRLVRSYVPVDLGEIEETLAENDPNNPANDTPRLD